MFRVGFQVFCSPSRLEAAGGRCNESSACVIPVFTRLDRLVPYSSPLSLLCHVEVDPIRGRACNVHTESLAASCRSPQPAARSLLAIGRHVVEGFARVWASRSGPTPKLLVVFAGVDRNALPSVHRAYRPRPQVLDRAGSSRPPRIAREDLGRACGWRGRVRRGECGDNLLVLGPAFPLARRIDSPLHVVTDRLHKLARPASPATPLASRTSRAHEPWRVRAIYTLFPWAGPQCDQEWNEESVLDVTI